ncbi:hypothetical protein FGO68_gene17351 [Halteria grandinella]|uniref:Uncharacterized protein n=1 Tax=Halteria grandinella TaxID=5974 RepID=A0A8J8SUX1_HALGN|nr:hypothetical protein FGO68_gene17351 [Halteria grandinella]
MDRLLVNDQHEEDHKEVIDTSSILVRIKTLTGKIEFLNGVSKVTEILELKALLGEKVGQRADQINLIFKIMITDQVIRCTWFQG